MDKNTYEIRFCELISASLSFILFQNIQQFGYTFFAEVDIVFVDY